MILDFKDENHVRRLIDLNQVVAVIYNPYFQDKEKRISLQLRGNHSVIFKPPEDMDMDLILAHISNCMNKRSQSV